MLQAIIGGESDPAQLADLAWRRLRGKIPQLQEALYGKISEHHRWMLALLWDPLAAEAFIARLDERIAQLTRPQQPALEKLDAIPGIDRRVAEVVLAEIGPDMSPFPSHAHLASWAGVCPGNNESAGKRRSGKTTKGSRWLRQALVQAAWAASHKKDSYFQAHAHNLMRRRGRKRGLVGVAHSLLLVIYHILHDGTDYRDLGRDFLDRIRATHLIRYHLKQLQQLGFTVTLAPCFLCVSLRPPWFQFSSLLAKSIVHSSLNFPRVCNKPSPKRDFPWPQRELSPVLGSTASPVQ